MTNRTFNETFHSHEFVISTANGNISLEQGVVSAPAGGLDAGTILGKVAATGVYAALDPTASDGSEAFAGILLNDAEEGDLQNAIFARHGEVAEGRIIYPDGADAAGKITINTAMESKDIFVRSTPREIT